MQVIEADALPLPVCAVSPKMFPVVGIVVDHGSGTPVCCDSWLLARIVMLFAGLVPVIVIVTIGGGGGVVVVGGDVVGGAVVVVGAVGGDGSYGERRRRLVARVAGHSRCGGRGRPMSRRRRATRHQHRQHCQTRHATPHGPDSNAVRSRSLFPRLDRPQ